MPTRNVQSHRDVLMAKDGLSQSQADAAQVRMEQTAAGEGWNSIWSAE
jgi:hypothetical protein